MSSTHINLENMFDDGDYSTMSIISNYLPCWTVLIWTVLGMVSEPDVQDGLLAFVLNNVLINVDFPRPDDPA